MIGGLGFSTMGVVIAGALAVAAAPQGSPAPAETAAPGAEASAGAAGDALGAMIESRLRADGPFFTPEERIVIERACGYAPGEWDGFEVNIGDDGLRCSNGRRAEGPEVRAVLAAAEPRIEARVERVMASAEVREAIARVAEAAAAEATREVELAMAGLEDMDIDVDVDPDVDTDIDVDDDPDPDDED